MMASSVAPTPRPQWNDFRVATFAGQLDTHIRTGEDYETLTLAEVFTMQPAANDKRSSPACIPSSYCDYDAREHARQREAGAYVALAGDVDKGDHTLDRIAGLARRFAGDAAWLVYSSAHARAGDMRWRIIIPLERPASFSEWYDAQTAFFDFMEAAGVEMDRALSRSAQPVYLPNVPRVHEKSGTVLRDDSGSPIFYQTASAGTTAPGLDITQGIIAGGIAAIRRRRLEDDRERARIRDEAMRRRANRPTGDNDNIIADFNANNSIAAMLELCGYEQSPRNADDWRSPNQTGDTYATRIIEDKWVSLSASDAACGVGEKCKSGCYGDAYDLFVHYKHRGDHKAAFRSLHAERRASNPNVVYGAFAPPPLEAGDPGWQEIPDWMEEDGSEPAQGDFAPAEHVRLIEATPFTWRPSAAIPKRQWLYGKHLLRKFVSVDVAAGGVGKSSLKIGEALSIASGKDFYGRGLPEGARTVWMWNLEDPHEEIERRIHATALKFKISPEDVGNRLYVDSGRDKPLVIATEGPDGAMICRPVVDALIEEMLRRQVDVLTVDPFISSHAVSENDNNAIDIVAREWNVVAERTNAAINLVHHVRKQNGMEATADSARGASALIGKARSVLVYNRMTQEEADALQVNRDERKFFFRVDNDKANLAPPDATEWYRMNNVDLDNGDSVGVACSWTPPDAFEGVTKQHLIQVQRGISEGRWRENAQSKAWAGVVVASVLGLDESDKKHKARITKIIRRWVSEGALEVVKGLDEKRMEKDFIVVGRWVKD